jgi:hypothetical protein
VLPPLFRAIGEILTAWLNRQISTEAALAQMHDAVTAAGVDMSSFEGQLASQHADFEAQLKAIAALATATKQ